MQRNLLAAGLRIPKSTSLHSLLQGKIKGLDADLKFTKLTTFRYGPSTNFTKLLFLCYVNNKAALRTLQQLRSAFVYVIWNV